MKKFLWLFCVLFITTMARAQEFQWREIPFSELGWDRDQKLEGSNPSYTLYLPNFPGVDWERSYLALQVEASPALSSSSSLTVYGDGNLLFTAPLRRGVFSIPLRELSPKEELHRLEIQPYLFISNNLCEDLASGNLFCTLKKEGQLVLFFKDTSLTTLTDFLRFPDNRMEIILPPGKWSRALQEAYFTLYAFLQRYFRDLPMHIETRVSEEEKSFLPEHRRIFLREKAERDFELSGKSLFLTPQGVTAMVQDEKLLAVPSLKISTIESTSPKVVRRLYLNGFSFRGIGTLTETFYFASSDLGGLPETLKLVLYRSHSPLRAQFQGEASFTVRLNGEPVYTERLGNEPVVPRTPQTIFLPSRLLRRENALEFRFSYFPEIGNCHRGEKPLEASISSDSYIEARGQGVPPFPLTWEEVPTFFWGKGFVVLPDEPTLQDLQIGAKILAALRSLDRTPLSVNVLTPKEVALWLSRPPLQLKPWQRPFQRFTLLRQEVIHYALSLENQNLPLLTQIATLLHFTVKRTAAALGETMMSFFASFTEVDTLEPPSYFILVNVSLDRLSTPLTLEGDELVLKDLSEGKTLMRFGPDEPLGVLTTFWENGYPVILFTGYGEKEVAVRYFLNTFQEPQTLRRLNGNVALFTKNGLVSVLAGSGSNTSRKTVFPEWSGRLRLVTFLFLIGLIVLLAGLLYNRLVRPKTS